MCGIAGFFSSTQRYDAGQRSRIATQMADAEIARGPDDGGVWVDADAGIALSHRRLSIIDLSPEGHQPKPSASGRYVVSYNGEIYNYRELRARLSYPWRGSSDTEVLLAAIETWGVEKALQELNGMFAFAVWDKQERALYLARDRMGEKPLYYGWSGEAFIFASELKAFRVVPGWKPTINRNALHHLMRYSYIPAPHSIYEQIQKLKPGHYLCLKQGKVSEQKPYWSFETMAGQSIKNRISCSDAEATDILEAVMKKSVSQRVIADVPLGAFLSGGVDSSTIVALMQAQSSQRVRTFTIGFKEQGFDEAPYAKAVAAHLGTDHTEVYVSPREAEAAIPHLAHFYDEPFADSSQIPTYLVSRMARQHVTVALSGDGGDELFGGYNRYVRGPLLWRTLSSIPLPLRQVAAKVLSATHSYIAPESKFARKLGNYYEKMATKDGAIFYRNLCSVNGHPEQVVLGGREPEVEYAGNDLKLSYAEWMMMQDALTYFPGDILTKVDRAAMAVSLETRTPFTDVELMQFAWRVPLHMKVRGGKGKWLLRQLLYRYVPEHLIERPKAGFAIPIGRWLRGPLKEWAEALIEPTLLAKQGFLNPTAVHKMWNTHQSGQRDLEHQLWNILMFQSWLEKQ